MTTDKISNHVRAAENLIASVTKADAMNPAKRILQPGDHADVIALAQVNATLAQVEVLREIADSLDGIARYGNGRP